MAGSFRRPKDGQSLTDEVQACCKQAIEKVNKRVVTARVRGEKRKNLKDAMNAERVRVVKLIRTSGVRVKA
eukprot:924233-Lingulodinium_polyedra.AAC.1